MAEEPVANKNQPPSEAPDAEYDRIFATLAETETGRRFLEEYARRCRPAETSASLAAIERLHAVVRAGGASERLRLLNEIVEMAEAITRVRAEIMAIKPPGGKMETTEVLDSIVRTTEEATSSILAATEQMQETASALRARGAEQGLCDRFDALVTEIYTACTFQDLTGQRTRKVIDVLQDLEGRINTIIGASDSAAAEIAALEKTNLAQADVDAMLAREPEEERQDASLEDISRFMQALEPLIERAESTAAAAAAVSPAEDARPELSVVDAVIAEAVPAHAITAWEVAPAAARSPRPLAQEAAAEWIVDDASPLPDAEPDWMILRRIEMELDAQEEAGEPVTEKPPEPATTHNLLPPADLDRPASGAGSEPRTAQESQSAAAPENAPPPRRETKGKEEADDFLFDPNAPAWEREGKQRQGAKPPSPDPTTKQAHAAGEEPRAALPAPTLARPQTPESADNESARPRASYDPLAPIRAMSDEQKIALFS